MDPTLTLCIAVGVVVAVVYAVVMEACGVKPGYTPTRQSGPTPAEYREAVYLASVDLDRRNNYLNPSSRDR